MGFVLGDVAHKTIHDDDYDDDVHADMQMKHPNNFLAAMTSMRGDQVKPSVKRTSMKAAPIHFGREASNYSEDPTKLVTLCTTNFCSNLKPCQYIYEACECI